MNKEEAKVKKEEARRLKKDAKKKKREEKLRKQYAKVMSGNKFTQWRNKRPFWGATLTVLAGLLILYIPLHLYAIAFIPGSLVFIGFLFGGLTLIIGVLVYIYPQFSTVFGVVTLFLSVLSIMGALGGFLIGTILGIIAGSLCIAWQEEEIVIEQNDDNKKPNISIENNQTNSLQV
jgi:hypothetical protein